MNALDWEETHLAHLVEIGEKTATISVEKLSLLIGFARASIDYADAVDKMDRIKRGKVPHDLLAKRTDAVHRRAVALAELTREE